MAALARESRGQQRMPRAARSRPPHGNGPVKTRCVQPGFLMGSPSRAAPTEPALEAAMETAPTEEPIKLLGAA
jgi:hypothetical protein